MKTIKHLFVAIFLFVGMSLNAQDNPFTFGVKGGINMSTLTGDPEDTKVRLGYNIGLTLDYAINQDWYVLSGLQYTTKGTNFKKVMGVKTSIHAAYLQIPIHAGYKLEVTPATTLVFRGGPFLAYGINGDMTVEESGVKLSESTFDYCKRFDMGLGFGVGAEFGKVGLDLGWDFGFINIVDEGEGKARTGTAYLSVSYKF